MRYFGLIFSLRTLLILLFLLNSPFLRSVLSFDEFNSCANLPFFKFLNSISAIAFVASNNIYKLPSLYFVFIYSAILIISALHVTSNCNKPLPFPFRFHIQPIFVRFWVMLFIQGVTGGKGQTSGGCSLC